MTLAVIGRPSAYTTQSDVADKSRRRFLRRFVGDMFLVGATLLFGVGDICRRRLLASLKRSLKVKVKGKGAYT